jgi:hypothetical protein
MFVRQLRRSFSQRDHASLHAHSPELCAVELVRAPRELFKVDVSGRCHLARVDLQDLRTRGLFRQRKLDLSIQPTRTEEGRVEDVDSVGGGDDLNVERGNVILKERKRGGGGTNLDALVAAKTVELIQQLQHRPLHLTIATLLRVEPLRADGVQLVDEDDGGSLLFRQLERIADQFSAVTDEHLDE